MKIVDGKVEVSESVAKAIENRKGLGLSSGLILDHAYKNLYTNHLEAINKDNLEPDILYHALFKGYVVARKVYQERDLLDRFAVKDKYNTECLCIFQHGFDTYTVLSYDENQVPYIIMYTSKEVLGLLNSGEWTVQ